MSWPSAHDDVWRKINFLFSVYARDRLLRAYTITRWKFVCKTLPNTQKTDPRKENALSERRSHGSGPLIRYRFNGKVSIFLKKMERMCEIKKKKYEWMHELRVYSWNYKLQPLIQAQWCPIKHALNCWLSLIWTIRSVMADNKSLLQLEVFIIFWTTELIAYQSSLKFFCYQQFSWTKTKKHVVIAVVRRCLITSVCSWAEIIISSVYCASKFTHTLSIWSNLKLFLFYWRSTRLITLKLKTAASLMEICIHKGEA